MQVFFYGLFMDVDILARNGVHPSNPRTGYLNDYELKIGDRASLVPCDGDRSYGIVMAVDEDAIHRLYAEASVADYVPEEVRVTMIQGGEVTATCYNLPPESLTGTNHSYAKSLYELALRLSFPEDYLAKIRLMMKD